ncbi:nitroreductase family protein [Nocardioides pelophilus]|uniref:nitroreductase family protein n=1 Tax=Nocardioides pelophilus TaxID=2172019 RepID=UPI001604080D|nr:nitroreductase family protein [Nocardioides pelophilus]
MRTARPSSTLEALTEVLDRRSSCRGFTREPVDPLTLRRLFEVAQRTPSWCNSQAWQVHLLSGTGLAALSERLVVMPRHVVRLGTAQL